MNKPSVDRFTVGQRLSLMACTDCRMCVDVCPAARAAGSGKLSAPYRMKELKRILAHGKGGWLTRILGPKPMTQAGLREYSETVFRCTLCGNCQEICPVGIPLKELWLCLREDLVDSACFPKKINMIRRNLKESRNVFGEDNEERAEWVEDMDDPPDDLFVKDTASVVYFTGCTAAYFPVAQKIPLALARLLVRARVDFTLLGEEEWCCGFPLLGAGLRDLAAEYAGHNIRAVLDKGARDVVFACPSCFEMWKENYPYAKHGIRIHHSTQYLRQLIDNGGLKPGPLDMTVTYHDPCDLGRGAREFDAPRRVIAAIPGLRFVEMPNNRENCTCCGGGGNLEMVDANLSAKIAKRKLDEALSTKADAIVTACQQCVRSMLTHTRRNKISMEVMDITQLLERATADKE